MSDLRAYVVCYRSHREGAASPVQHTQPISTTLRYYVEFRDLPDGRPAHVVRHRGVTVLLIDPRCTRFQIAMFMADNLTVAEANIGRQAYGEPPVGQSADAYWMEDGPIPREIPEAVRLPSRAADLEASV